mgnify:CR=1 FL=1
MRLTNARLLPLLLAAPLLVAQTGGDEGGEKDKAARAPATEGGQPPAAPQKDPTQDKDFQMKVWTKLRSVGFGKTTTYKALARAAGKPAATRAVGGANHRNPVSIVVPCHRVVGSDGRLTGYGGGLWRKDWLLRHEGHDLLKI